MKNFFGDAPKQGESDQAKKAKHWSVAIGLQQVDDLTPSAYLLEVAGEHIRGKLSIDAAHAKIDGYYRENPATTAREIAEREADMVAVRIAWLLGTDAFSFCPAELLAIHGCLFAGLLDESLAGSVRTYDIRKKEPILNGESVLYCMADSIGATLDYDFAQEKRCRYASLPWQAKVEQVATFISGIWQIHPFAEGNTRTIAVFTLKYLKMLGFEARIDLFVEQAKYFRNALVRANYQDFARKIPSSMEYLHKFFANLLLGTNHVLDWREMQLQDDSLSWQTKP